MAYKLVCELRIFGFFLIFAGCGKSGRPSVSIPVSIVLVMKGMTSRPGMVGHGMNNAQRKSGNAIGGFGLEEAVVATVMHERKTSA
jgi:hypothetical protein